MGTPKYIRLTLVVLLLGCVAGVHSQSTATGAAITGTVSDERSQAPIGGAIVYLGVQGSGPSSDTPRVITDSQGRFVFGAVPAGSGYFMSVGKPGWFNTGYLSQNGSSTFSLTAGQHLAVNLLLTPAAAIVGELRNGLGEAMTGASVRALRIVHFGEAVQLVPTAVSVADDRGAFRLAGLAAGSYYVYAAGASEPDIPAAEGQASRVAGFYPGAPDERDATEIQVVAGEERTSTNFALTSSPGLTVAGKTVGERLPAGSPLYLFRGQQSRFGPDLAFASTTVDAAGTFHFWSIPSGTYMLVGTGLITTYAGTANSSLQPATTSAIVGLLPRAAGLVSSAAPNLVNYQAYGPASPDAVPWIAETPVQVGASGVNIDLPVRAGTKLSGEVITDGDGLPRSIPIYVEPADGHAMHGIQTATRLGETFTLTGLLDGRYFLRVGRTPGRVVRSILWNGRDLTTSPIEAPASGELRDVRVTLTSQVSKISGTVTGPPAKPRLVVVLFPCDSVGQSVLGLTPPVVRSAQAVPGGEYAFPDLPAGRYCVTALDPQAIVDQPSTAVLTALAAGATHFTLNWGETRKVDVASAGGR